MLQPQKIIVPGIFLLLLGVGNIYVGIERGTLAQAALSELSGLEPLPKLVSSSPLMRLQLKELSTEKLYQKRKAALSRITFYRLVELGGRVFVMLSLICLLAGVSARLFQSEGPTKSSD